MSILRTLNLLRKRMQIIMADKVAQITDARGDHKGKPRVAVYGTLKMGHPNHRLLEGQHYLGRCMLKDKYLMYSLGGFPAIVRVHDKMPEELQKLGTEVSCEVYAVDGKCLDALDLLEGNGSFYTRQKVVTPWKNTWVYLFPDDAYKNYPNNALVKDGVWKPETMEQAWLKSKSSE